MKIKSDWGGRSHIGTTSKNYFSERRRGCGHGRQSFVVCLCGHCWTEMHHYKEIGKGKIHGKPVKKYLFGVGTVQRSREFWCSQKEKVEILKLQNVSQSDEMFLRSFDICSRLRVGGKGIRLLLQASWLGRGVPQSGLKTGVILPPGQDQNWGIPFPWSRPLLGYPPPGQDWGICSPLARTRTGVPPSLAKTRTGIPRSSGQNQNWGTSFPWPRPGLGYILPLARTRAGIPLPLARTRTGVPPSPSQDQDSGTPFPGARTGTRVPPPLGEGPGLGYPLLAGTGIPTPLCSGQD